MVEQTVKPQTATDLAKLDNSWLDPLVVEIKQIMVDWAKETFFRYRKCGQLIINSGYRKGQWHSEHREYFLKALGIGERTLRYMVQLGEMKEEEFGNAIAKFPSFFNWANPPREQNKLELKDLPNGKFRTIVIDPPWEISKIIREVRPNQTEFLDYKTMTIEEIKEIPIANLAADGCHVYLWVTHRYLPSALEIFEHWRVDYECILTWIKNVGFTPYSWMYSTEHVLFGRIGSLPLLQNGLRVDFNAVVREHSRKPNEFFELVRKVSPEPRIEFFAREQHEGFTAVGDEIDKFTEVGKEVQNVLG